MVDAILLIRPISFVLAICALAEPAFSTQDAEDGEARALAPGLAVEFAGGGSKTSRVDPVLAFDWGRDRPDALIASSAFTATWRGQVFVPEDGDYRLYVRASGGRARLRLSDLDVTVAGSERETSKHARRTFEYGYLPITLEFAAGGGGAASLAVYWESEHFALEPIGPGALFHEAGATRGDAAARAGHALVRSLGCAACHSISGVGAPRPAPSLLGSGRDLSESYLRARLRDPSTAHAGSRMPAFDFEDDDIDALVAYLSLVATEHPHAPPVRSTSSGPSAERGRAVVEGAGCLACHVLDGNGLGAVGRGGALERVGVHRTKAALRRLLASDGTTNHGHRPVLRWRGSELDDVVSFLTGLSRPGPPATAKEWSSTQSERGKELAGRWCVPCHELPAAATPERAVLRPIAAPQELLASAKSCVSPRADPRTRPRYWLTPNQLDELKAFLSRPAGEAEARPLSRYERGRQLVEDNACLDCHRRGADFPFGEVVAALSQARPNLRGSEGALRPPSLSSIGDKMSSERIVDAVSGEGAGGRSWLRVRMPVFRHFSADERDAVAHYFAAADRVPDELVERASANALPQSATSGELFGAGTVLVGAGGFGCASCHGLGDYQPQGVAPNVRGPDLVGLERRMRKSWFLRWMRDPSRIVPGVEMPQVPAGASKLLGGDWTTQMDALWHALNAPEFSPPPASHPARVVQPRDKRAAVVRDVFRHRGVYGEGWTPRAFAIGTPPGHHLLIDLDTFAPRAWWAGNFAAQLTQGKTWLWEPLGVPVLPVLPRLSNVAMLRSDGSLVFPRRSPQSAGRLHSWAIEGEGVRIEYELTFPDGVSATVLETITASHEGYRRALTTKLSSTGDSGMSLVFVQALPSEPKAKVSETSLAMALAAGEVTMSASGPNGEARTWRVVHPAARESIAESVAVTAQAFLCDLDPRPGGDVAESGVVIDARVPLPAATLEARQPSNETREVRVRRQLDAVPGFSCERLPLPEALMPTSFAFETSGAVLATSLKGDLWRLRDTSGDGLEDEADIVSPVLAAPFGLRMDQGGVLASHKPELVRLFDGDEDGFFERADVVATGWGYTHDYHDWTIGIAERQGAPLVLLASDYAQGGRDRSTTLHRGKAVQIGVDGAVHEIASGLRYPIGLAQNERGEIFFTDNQGVQNTFNEINLLREGVRYGVPALHDERSTKVAPATIRVPHPWMRSVNGIAFLEADGTFGPFEGHGVGCEYDNRRLIRFSIDRVGDTVQGACYPLSEARSGDAGFLGPIGCAVRSDGALYVGNIRDSGWGGGGNVGSVLKLRLTKPAPGIREVRVHARGFDIALTETIESAQAEAAATDPASYRMSAYRRIWKGDYGTPDSDRHVVTAADAALSNDRRTVRLTLSAPLRRGFLYEIHTDDFFAGQMWPREAYYTVNAVPRR